MRAAAVLLLLLGACGSEAPQANEAVDLPEPSGPPLAQQIDAAPASAPNPGEGGWESVASGEGIALRFVAPGGKLLLSIACLGMRQQLVAAAPGFSPIGSEDRFSLGLGQEPVTLVADPTRQAAGGVTAEGGVPPNFEDLLEDAEQVSALYGTQSVGPLPAPAKALREALAKSCTGSK